MTEQETEDLGREMAAAAERVFEDSDALDDDSEGLGGELLEARIICALLMMTPALSIFPLPFRRAILSDFTARARIMATKQGGAVGGLEIMRAEGIIDEPT